MSTCAEVYVPVAALYEPGAGTVVAGAVPPWLVMRAAMACAAAIACGTAAGRPHVRVHSAAGPFEYVVCRTSAGDGGGGAAGSHMMGEDLRECGFQSDASDSSPP